MKFHSIIFWQCSRIYRAALIMLVVTSACDELPPEEGLPAVSIAAIADISLYANTEAVIPISSYITSPIKLRIECTPNPTLGYVEALSDGNFKYTPFINAIGTEVVTFTIRDAETDEEVLPSQALTVNIREYANTNDCQHIPFPDVVYPWSLQNNSVTIDPIENDEACSGSYKLSVYKPSRLVMPRLGEASVVTSSTPPYTALIEYKPDNGILARDAIMYKIMYTDNPGNVQYGLIAVAPVCEMPIRDDFASMSAPNDSLIIYLNQNDDLYCNDTVVWWDFALLEMPKYGTVTMDVEPAGPFPGGSYVIYKPTSAVGWEYDSIVYQMCDFLGACYAARLIISAKPNSCATSAADDRVTYHERSKVDIEVLSNDEICGLNPKLTVKTPPQHGTIEVDERNHRFTYSPTYKLNDSFEYLVCTARACKQARVIIVPRP